MGNSFTESMVRLILNMENSPTKFEKFCCELFSDIDNCIYVPTSWNYDQGRDGRTSSLREDKHPPVLCVSLCQDTLKKAEEDAKKLSSKTYPPKIIRFCVILDGKKDATENLLDKAKDIFKREIKDLETVIADGSIQIAGLAVQHPEYFEKYYLSELMNLRRALAVDSSNTEKIQLTGMRIALTTQFSEDAQQLRDDLQKNLILLALSEGESTINSICKNVSDSLKLPNVIKADYLIPTLENLGRLNFIKKNRDKYEIKKLGKQELKKRTEIGAKNLIDGQQLIRDLIFELTGEKIDSSDFSKVWNIVQDEIANMFLVNGIYIIQSIESIIENESKIGDHQDLQEAIQVLAQKIADLEIWGDHKDDLYQSIIDIFHENDSLAYKWLTQLGTIYISLCSLGLDTSAQNQIEERLRTVELLLDTDIVLSFLSPGESRYEATQAVVRTWQRINGNIYVAPCVLEETAYHAWISQNEYEDVWRNLDKYNDQNARRLLNNAFLRGFRIESKGKYSLKYWSYYIKQFKGSEPYDYSKIEDILKDSYIFKTSDENIDMEFARKIEDSLIQKKFGSGIPNEDIEPEERDKYHRDGILMAVLLKHRSKSNSLVVSSSPKLCEVCKDYKDKLGSLEPVAPISAIAYLLTMVPGSNMNLGTLKGLLFDTGYAEKIRGVERLALRMIHSSEEYFMPFSRRATLKKALNDEIGKVATQYGRNPREIREDIENKKLDSESTTTIITESIDKLVQSKSERTIQELRQKIRELESKR